MIKKIDKKNKIKKILINTAPCYLPLDLKMKHLVFIIFTSGRRLALSAKAQGERDDYFAIKAEVACPAAAPPPPPAAPAAAGPSSAR
jgi:hypothetical protein